MNNSPEFDKFAGSYEDLLKDPIRDRFSPGGSQFFHTRVFPVSPGGLYKSLGKLEGLLRAFPLGGQYAVFAKLPVT